MTAAVDEHAPALLAAVRSARAELGGLSDPPGSGAWSLTAAELADGLRDALALRAQVDGVLGALTREADGRGLPAQAGARSTAGWVRAATRLDPAEARELVDLAAATDPKATAAPGRCPAAGAALRDGLIHPAQARAITAASRALPAAVDAEPGLRELAEAWMVDQAESLDARELATAGRALRETLTQRVGAVDVDDPAEAARLAAEADRTAYDQRTITRHRHLPGLARIRMMLPEDLAAALFAALDPLAKPRPTDDGLRDARTPGQRRADAFEELLDLATHAARAEHADTADTGGTAEQTDTDGTADPAGESRTGFDDNGAATAAPDAWPSDGATAPAEDQFRPTHPRRTPTPAPTRAPTPTPTPVQVLVTMGLELLEARRPLAGWLDTGEALTPGQLRRLLCDAALIPVVLGGRSQPLDVGRARRTFTPAQRAGMLIRDGGCAGLGCDPHPRRAHAHHLTEWGHGGHTNLDDGALLCGSWHRRVHAEGWQVRLAANGHPELIPPTWIDPHQRPRQNHRFRHPTPATKPPPYRRN